MVRPLYPLRKPPKAKKEAPEKPVWQSLHFIAVAVVIVLLLVVIGYKSVKSPTSIGSKNTVGRKKQSLFSFLSPSKAVSVNDASVEKLQDERLVNMGIASSSAALMQKVEAKNFCERRKIMAMRKYEAAKETAERYRARRDEMRRKLSSPASLQLKDAVLALEDSSTLGIMKLERMLDERFNNTGVDSTDLEALIFAYDNLAKAYEKKNMPTKAKEAYKNAFTLMKRISPASEGAEWNAAISNIEQANCLPSRGN